MLRTDEQTIKDLGIFGKRDGNGIFDIYNQSHTRGGETLLERIFLHPLSDRDAINTRSNIIESFARTGLSFPYNAAMFDMAEKYLGNTKDNPQTTTSHGTLGEKRNSERRNCCARPDPHQQGVYRKPQSEKHRCLCC